jgi:hypothetical protein
MTSTSEANSQTNMSLIQFNIEIMSLIQPTAIQCDNQVSSTPSQTTTMAPHSHNHHDHGHRSYFTYNSSLPLSPNSQYMKPTLPIDWPSAAAKSSRQESSGQSFRDFPRMLRYAFDDVRHVLACFCMSYSVLCTF